jgi:hypothetical protein
MTTERNFIFGTVSSNELVDINYFLINLKSYTVERWYEWEIKSYDILIIIDKETGNRMAIEKLGDKKYNLVPVKFASLWDYIRTFGKLKLHQQYIGQQHLP